MPLGDPQALINSASRRRRKASAWLIGVNIAVALLLLGLVWLVSQSSRRAFEAQAHTFAEGLASVAQVNIQSEFDRIADVLRATAVEVEPLMRSAGPLHETELTALLQARSHLLEGIEGVRLADAQGRVRWGTGLPAGPPIDVTDRDYFRAAQQQTAPTTFIAGPLKSRVSGNWVVAFVRPIQIDGRFAGLLYVSVNADHFRHLFEQYDLESRDAVTLRRTDRRLVARYSPGSAVQGQPGDMVVSPELMQALDARSTRGLFVSRTAVDRELRTTAYRTLKGWPFIVLAGVYSERFLEPWRQQVRHVAALAGLAWLITAVAAWWLLRANRRVETAMREVAEQGKRMQALLRTAADGIHIIDRDGHLVELSDSFAEMLKSTREGLLGRHISSWDVNLDRPAIDRWLTKAKPGDRHRIDAQHRRDDGQIIDVELQLSVAEIAGQLYVFASSRDVTEQRRLMREQTAMLNSDLVGMTRVVNRTIVWRNRAAERMLGYGQGELQGLPVKALYWDVEDYERIGVEGYQAMRDAGHYRTQLRMRRKSGEPIWVDFGSAPLSDTEIFVMLVDITATREALDQLVHASSHDALTNLPNRVLLHDRIARALAVARRQKLQTVVCYLDLDGFKAVNDVHGHEAGDHLLQVVASRLVASIRPSDTAARLGGDEFVLVLICVEDESWRAVVDRVIQALGEPVELAGGTRVTVGATVGVTVAAWDETASPQELIARADHVMLRGKRHGKGRVFV